MAADTESEALKNIKSLCKRRGFIFPGSEIYQGFANQWDWGPLGVELCRNVRETWWKRFVTDREDMVGLDSSIVVNPKVWEASGHVENFNDPLVDCKECRERWRGDNLLADKLGGEFDGRPLDEITRLITENDVRCPNCGGELGEAKKFDLMFKTHVGPVEDDASVAYLRPETAQGIFYNFALVQSSMRMRVPFGIAQIGKAFRNEITTGNFIFRTREFEQMEIEFFCRPGTEIEWFEHWQQETWEYYLSLGVNPEKLRWREHEREQLSHYSNRTADLEYYFPWEKWGELQGTASRTDYDLTQHQAHSGQKMEYRDPYTNEVYIPYVVEPSFGVNRAVLAILCDAYDEDEIGGEKRTVLRLNNAMAPCKVAVFPLSKKDPLVAVSKPLFDDLRVRWPAMHDVGGSIGKRYRRHDEIGTPYCITVDFESLDDKKATIRHRDSTQQDRVALDGIAGYLEERLGA
jgi:glycyl-tRNA synthetase